jgi:hypothetical protein
MDVCLLCLYVVLSCVGRGVCDGLITRPEESYRVSVCVWSRNSRKGGHRSVLDYKRLWMYEWMNEYNQISFLHFILLPIIQTEASTYRVALEHCNLILENPIPIHQSNQRRRTWVVGNTNCFSMKLSLKGCFKRCSFRLWWWHVNILT